jgi:spore protease
MKKQGIGINCPAGGQQWGIIGEKGMKSGMLWESEGKRSAEGRGLDTGSFQVRTDLAREAHDLALEKRTDGSGIPGVRMEEDEERDIRVSWIWVENEEGARELGK